MRDETIKTIAIAAMVTFLTGIYLAMGNNGVVFSGALALLAGIGGFAIGKKKE